MFNFTLKIAFRYLLTKKSHSAVNIITIISVCGVVVTTAALICIMSVFNGFSALVESKLAQLDPQIKVYPAQGKIIENADSVICLIKKVSTDIDLALPVIEEHALAVYGDRQMPVKLKGVPEKYDSLTEIQSIIKNDGSYILSDEIANYAVLSVGTAVNLKAHPGFYTILRLYAPKRKGNINLANPVTAFRTDSLFVSGVFQTEQNEYDNDMIIVSQEVAQKLFDYRNEASAIEIKLKDTNAEKDIISKVAEALGDTFVVKDRLQQQQTSFQMINIEKWITFLLLGFILIIATFNVISTLSVLIIEKDESITAFKNLGATNKQITGIFVAEGWLISLSGACIGILLGLILSLIQQFFGVIKLSGNTSAMIVDIYPVKVELSDIAIIFILVAGIGLITSLTTSFIMQKRLKRL